MNDTESLIMALLVVAGVALWIALLFPGTIIGLVGSAVAVSGAVILAILAFIAEKPDGGG